MKKLMVILERYLDVSGTRLRIGGVVTREVAHFSGVPHGAAQIGIVLLRRVKDEAVPHLLLHWRDKEQKVFPETWDICGGHLEATEEVLRDSDRWEDCQLIKELFVDTSLREANEEFCIPSKPNFTFTGAEVKRFGAYGEFECGFDVPDCPNREYSTLYLAFVPASVLTLGEADDINDVVRVEESVLVDGVLEGRASKEVRLLTVADLCAEFQKGPGDYADGVGRVMTRLIEQPESFLRLTRFLERYYKT